MNVMNPIVLEDIKSEITKSLKSINYSQWERQPKSKFIIIRIYSTYYNKRKRIYIYIYIYINKKEEEPVKQPKSRPLTSSNQKLLKSTSNLEKKSSSASKSCNHQHSKSEKHVFKTKRQLQEEENRKNILKVKINCKN
jgi:hypothetical protein